MKKKFLIKNLFRLVKECFKMDKNIFFLFSIRMIVYVINTVAAIYISKLIIDELTGQNRLFNIIAIVLITTGIFLVTDLIKNYVDSKGWYRLVLLRLKYVTLRSKKLLDMEYKELENPEVLDLLEKTNRGISSRVADSHCSIGIILNTLLKTLGANVIIMLWMGLILVFSDYRLIIIIIVTVFLEFFINKYSNKKAYSLDEKKSRCEREYYYYENKMLESKLAKEMRLYDLSSLYLDKYNEQGIKINNYTKQQINFNFITKTCTLIVYLIRYGLLNLLLVLAFIDSNITIGEFSLYLASAIAFSTQMQSFLEQIIDLYKNGLYLRDFFCFLDLPEKKEEGQQIESYQEIILSNVDFKYQSSKEMVLNNINLKIKKGDRIALVGENGCGKTTLIKLLTGLYPPTNGNIYFDNNNIETFNKREYYNLFSVVFQDINIFAMSIAENICLCEQKKIDFQKLEAVLKFSGLWEVVSLYKNGYHTQLTKIFDKEGTELSMGQQQKLAIARAHYHNNDIIILDEPTAFLDPLAEYEIYNQFNNLIEEKTAIYISHRLSSTRFCDYIIYMEKGAIVEKGTHEELMLLNGKYADMFNKQSFYYKEKTNERL